MYLFGLRGGRGSMGKDNLFYNPGISHNRLLSNINLLCIGAAVVLLAAGLCTAPHATVRLALMPLLSCSAVNLLIGYMQVRTTKYNPNSVQFLPPPTPHPAAP